MASMSMRHIVARLASSAFALLAIAMAEPVRAAEMLEAELAEIARSTEAEDLGDNFRLLGGTAAGRVLTFHYRLAHERPIDQGGAAIYCDDAEMRGLIDAGATIRAEFSTPDGKVFGAWNADSRFCERMDQQADGSSSDGDWPFEPDRIARALSGKTLEEALATIASSVTRLQVSEILTILSAEAEGTTLLIYVASSARHANISGAKALRNWCGDPGVRALLDAGAIVAAMYEDPEGNFLGGVSVGKSDCDQLAGDPGARVPVLEAGSTYDLFIRNTFRKIAWRLPEAAADEFRLTDRADMPKGTRVYTYEFTGDAAALGTRFGDGMAAWFCAYRDTHDLFDKGGGIGLLWLRPDGKVVDAVAIDKGLCSSVPDGMRKTVKALHSENETDAMIERFLEGAAAAGSALPQPRTIAMDPEIPIVTFFHDIGQSSSIAALRAAQLASLCDDPIVRKEIERGLVAQYVLERSETSEHGTITVDRNTCRGR